MSKKKKVQRATMAMIGAQKNRRDASPWQGCIQLDAPCNLLWTPYWRTKKDAESDARRVCAALGLKIVKELP